MEDDYKIELCNIEISDYENLRASMLKAYSTLENPCWEQDHIEHLIKIFPEGQLGIRVNGELVAGALAIILDYSKLGDDHTYLQVTGNYTFATHTSKGDVLYGIDVWVDPNHRNLRIGRRLYDARKELCERLNLRAIMAGGRIPHYAKYAEEFSAKEYLTEVMHRRIYDPTLTFQLSNGFHVKKILTKYLEGDHQSKDFATLLEWINIYYEAVDEQDLSAPAKTNVRLGIVQWQMRSQTSVKKLLEQVEFFVDAVSGYGSDFCLIPEYFNAPLMAEFDHLPEPDAIRHLAQYTDTIVEKLREMAVSYNVNILGGSMPVVKNDRLLNVGYLCRRDGTVESYEKIHITPSEKKDWGMEGGSKLKVYDTDAGKIGVLICYDVEFPELSRFLAEDGMQILFVPFQTDTQNGYMRVRSCAQARAIENECYVAISGSVGNLPRVSNMDLQYAQSAVFTPSDFSFPTTGIKSEATPNTEMTLIVDLDLELLTELHSHGSVRNLKDRRLDLYDLKRK